MDTYPALSVKQPWAQLIVHGIKDVENRTWRTEYRGPLLICASASPDRHAFKELAGRDNLTERDRDVIAYLQEFPGPNGVAVGHVHLVDVTDDDAVSRWASSGNRHWVLAIRHTWSSRSRSRANWVSSRWRTAPLEWKRPAGRPDLTTVASSTTVRYMDHYRSRYHVDAPWAGLLAPEPPDGPSDAELDRLANIAAAKEEREFGTAYQIKGRTVLEQLQSGQIDIKPVFTTVRKDTRHNFWVAVYRTTVGFQNEKTGLSRLEFSHAEAVEALTEGV
jgi:hypothetical protein